MAGRGRLGDSGAKRKSRREMCQAGGVQFALNVGYEEDLRRREFKKRGDFRVAGGIALGTGGSVEIGFNEARKVARGGVGEKKLLCKYAA